MISNAIPLRIAGVGYSVPKTVVTNEDLTKLYDTSDEWIYSRTGIKERRMVSGDESAFELGVDAAKNALAKSDIKTEDIELIIVATSAPSQLYPAMGCRIQAALGVPNNIPAFDITAACTGLIYALSIARGFISSGMYKNILIVATDNNSKLLDWSDRSCSILFGDGAGAMVVTAAEDGVDDIISIDIKSDGSIGNIIEFNLTGKNCPLVEPNTEKPAFITMNGKEVYRFVARVLPEYVEKLVADAGLKNEDIDYLIPHQANQRIIEAMQQRLEYPDEKVVSNIKYYGNTSAASIPIALVEGVQQGKVKLGSTAILCGFGAGMTWGAAVLRLREGIC